MCRGLRSSQTTMRNHDIAELSTYVCVLNLLDSYQCILNIIQVLISSPRIRIDSALAVFCHIAKVKHLLRTKLSYNQFP